MFHHQSINIDELKKLASKKCWQDDKDFLVYDYCGGNVDDAYWGGYDSGQILLARELLKQLEQ
jgi:hypothetical protein